MFAGGLLVPVQLIVLPLFVLMRDLGLLGTLLSLMLPYTAMALPIGVLVLTRLGVVSYDKLRRSRRYAILAIAVLAALLPTLDPITLVLEMVPLMALYEISIQLSRLVEPISLTREDASSGAPG